MLLTAGAPVILTAEQEAQMEREDKAAEKGK